MPSAASAKQVTIPLQITLPENVYAYVQKNAKDGNIQATLTSWISYYLSQISTGGMMLEAVDHEHLAKLRDGKKFRASRELKVEVERAMKRDDGQYTFPVQIDPANYPAFEENAAAQGVPVAQFFNDFVQWVIGSGLAYNFTPQNGIMYPATYEQVKAATAIFGKNVGASDFNLLIQEALDARARARREEDRAAVEVLKQIEGGSEAA
jgi:hypothetical protein